MERNVDIVHVMFLVSFTCLLVFRIFLESVNVCGSKEPFHSISLTSGDSKKLHSRRCYIAQCECRYFMMISMCLPALT